MDVYQINQLNLDSNERAELLIFLTMIKKSLSLCFFYTVYIFLLCAFVRAGRIHYQMASYLTGCVHFCIQQLTMTLYTVKIAIGAANCHLICCHHTVKWPVLIQHSHSQTSLSEALQKVSMASITF